MTEAEPRQAVRDGVEAVKAEMAQLRADIAELAKAMLEASASEAGEAKERLEAEAQRRIDQLQAAAEKLRQRGHRVIHELRGEIEKRPFAMVLGAVALGCVIGLLLNRRR